MPPTPRRHPISRVSLESHTVFGDDGGARELATATGDHPTGWTVAVGVRVGTTPATSTASAMSGGR